MKLLCWLSTCLLLTLLSPGSSVEQLFCRRCKSCKGIGKTLCPPRIKDKACFSKLMEFPLEGAPEDFKLSEDYGCTAQENCRRGIYTATLANETYIYIKVGCCEKIICNKIFKRPDKTDFKLNGMQCPGSLAKGKECSDQTTVSCRENENQCIQYIGELSNGKAIYGPIIFQGCATRNLCDMLMEIPGADTSLLTPINKEVAYCSPAEMASP